MNTAKKPEEIELDEFDRQFPKTDHPPLPLPRFGKSGPTRVVKLQPSGNAANTGSRPELFNLVWEDEGLGIRIDFLEKEGEILADVTGGSDQQGQTVVVALEAAEQLKFLQRSVTLALQKDNSCGGRVSFGATASVREKLGPEICADAFLMEPQSAGDAAASR